MARNLGFSSMCRQGSLAVVSLFEDEEDAPAKCCDNCVLQVSGSVPSDPHPCPEAGNR